MNVGSGSSLDWASHLNGIMKKRILLLGYLGFRSNPMDGQTIKTRQVYELIRKNIGDKVHLKYFDTGLCEQVKWFICRLITICGSSIRLWSFCPVFFIMIFYMY